MARLKLVVTACGTLVLAGCVGSPFGQVVKYDSAPHAAAGTITLSDPKVYSRESLISERSREVARIQKLIDGVDSLEFKPDIVREVETIRAIVATLAARSDPAAGLSARRAQETADLQQEISSLQLRAQLEQLRRDVELLRGKLPEQSEPLNKDLSILTAEKPAPAASGVSPPSIEYLIGRIDGAQKALGAQLAATGTSAALTSVAANPFDLFRDRQAYLDMARAARNASALDELHDLGNSALMRINLQAAVIPDPSYPKSLGAVQVSVEPTGFSLEAKVSFLSDWLDHLNGTAPRTAAGAFTSTSDAQQLVRSGRLVIFAVAGYEYALPRVTAIGTSDDLVTKLNDAKWDATDALVAARNVLSAHKVDPVTWTPVIRASCTHGAPALADGALQLQLQELRKGAHVARSRILTFRHASLIDRWQTARGQAPFARSVEPQYSRARGTLDLLRKAMAGIPECDAVASQAVDEARPIDWGALLPHLESASKVDKARIYEVGPREQVQQMSTVARSAESLMLAASLAASNPTSGVGAEAALGYSRQAMGRATTLERIPSVVGYSIGGQQTFGWVFGPRAWLDPKGRVDVEQALKPYDLSVDLSVPAWWPSLKLKVTTLWAPSPHALTSGALGEYGRGTREVEIPMSRRAPDYDWFTRTMTGAPTNAPKIEMVEGGKINACGPTTLLVHGRNLWRAEKVIVLGQALDNGAFAIAPDMDGIVVNAPMIQPLAGVDGRPAPDRDLHIHLITPFGRTKFPIPHVTVPAGDDCKPKKAEAAPDPNKVTIGSIAPELYFAIPAGISITVRGTNLDKISRVTLHGQPSKLVATATSLKVDFAAASTEAIPKPETVQLEFFSQKTPAEEERVDARSVRVVKR